MVRSMMAQVKLPISFWGDALLTAAYILCASKFVTSTSYELLWLRRSPELIHFRPWGLEAYVHNLSHKHGTLCPCGKKYIFIHYPEHSKGYVFIGENI